MDGWLVEAKHPPAGEEEPEAAYYAVWIADPAAATAAVSGLPGVGGAAATAVEPLGENALRTYGAPPGGTAAVPAPTS